jgi:hypothetical protein
MWHFLLNADYFLKVLLGDLELNLSISTMSVSMTRPSPVIKTVPDACFAGPSG